MSSLLTNESAMVALNTLRSINKNLAQVQNEISTGKTVSSARDNAAFWAVSTVMQSDVDGFGAIQKSLNLGSGTVGVARDAAEQITELLKDIKTIVVAAQEENVDRAKMQADIDQLRGQIDTIVSAAQFNGLNLLKATSAAEAELTATTTSTGVDFSDDLDWNALDGETFSIDGEVVYTFTDQANGQVADFLAAIEDAGYGVDVDDDGNLTITSSENMTIEFSDPGVGTALGIDEGEVEAVAAEGEEGDADVVNFLAALNRDANGIVTAATIQVNKFDLSTSEGGGLAALALINVLGDDAEAELTATATSTGVDFGDDLDWAALEDETFSIDGEVIYTFTDQNAGQVEDFLAAIEAAGYGVEVDDDGNLTITSSENMTIEFSDGAVGTALGIDEGEVEAVAAEGEEAVDALQTIENLIQLGIDAASAFGSAQKRIDIQGEFVTKLMDAMKLGIGALTDADMEEASARLQSLQVQQQLGIQALSIANQAPQALLQLFR